MRPPELLRAPSFGDEAKSRQAFLLNVVLWTMVPVPIPYLWATALYRAERLEPAVVESLVGEGSATRYDLDLLLKEGASAARSLRLLADYLEQNPDALIKGKYGGR